MPAPLRAARLAALTGILPLALAAATARASPHPSPPPAGYYATAQFQTGPALRSALHTRIRSGHTALSYGSTDEALKVLDRPTPGSSSVQLLYSGFLVPATNWINDPGGSGSQGWNREHIWPRARGVDDSGPDNSDLFHLRACDIDVNARRADLPFAVVAPGGTADPEAPDSRSTASWYEPRDADKGYVARALAYMAVRYEGGESATADLELVETPSGSLPQMGRLATLLAWHRDHPPTDWERARNAAVQGYQGNRNPFIDVPEWLEAAFVTAHPTLGSWRARHFTVEQLRDPAVTDGTRDLDGDGLTADLEFALQSDPVVPDAASRGPAASWVEAAGTSRLALTYRRLDIPAATYSGVSYTVQWAPAATGPWTAPTPVAVADVDEGDTRLVTVADPTPTASTHRYVRLVTTVPR